MDILTWIVLLIYVLLALNLGAGMYRTRGGRGKVSPLHRNHDPDD